MLVFVAFLGLLYCSLTYGHNTYFTCSGYPTLKTGISLMGSSTQSSSTRSIVVKRGNVALASGDTYVAGETLSVMLSNKGGEMILETSGATFPSGSCNGKYRFYGSTTSITMPSSGNVNIWAGWAPQKGAVYITPKFLLVAGTSPPTDAPTVSPTRIPTFSPTSRPTPLPTSYPTALPTFCPSVSPTSLPTSDPSSLPTPSPTSISEPPTSTPTTSQPTITFYPSPSPTALPTTHPTELPTSFPTTIPSGTPTAVPTTPPPTFSPTPQPTSSPTLFPTSSPTEAPSISPTPIPTAHPTIPIISLNYVLSLQYHITGATVESLRSHASVIQALTCANLTKSASDCLITSLTAVLARRSLLEAQPHNTNSIQLRMIIKNFDSSIASQTASSTVTSYLSSDFADDVYDAISVSISISAIESSTSNSAATDIYPYKCTLDSMKLSWFTDIFSVVHGVISGDQHWIAGGVVKEGSRLMVDQPRHIVYLFDSNINLFGRFELSKYSTSGVSYVDSDGITNAVRDNTTTYLHFSRVMNAAPEELFMFAAGSKLSRGHSVSGFMNVHWEKGTCSPVDELSPVIIEFYFALAGLLLLAIISTALVSKRTKLLMTTRIATPASYVPRILSDVTIGGAVGVACVWTWLILYCVLVGMRYVKEGYSVTRAYGIATGHIAVHLLSLTLLPVTRNSVWLHLLNCPFDRAIKYHRILAVAAVLVCSIHYALIDREWTFAYLVQNGGVIGRAVPIFGFIALVAMYAMLVSSYYYVRRFNYELFQLIHLLFIIVVISVCLHVPSNILYLIPSLLLYIIDIGYRWYQWTLPVTIVSMQVQDDFTILTILAPHIRNIGPGNYCFVNIPSVSLYQSHPFTLIPMPLHGSIQQSSKQTSKDAPTPTAIANVASGDLTKVSEASQDISAQAGTISVVMKTMPEGWTQALKSISTESAIHVTGPYGCLGFNILSYPHLLLVFGGVGITPMVSVMRSIFHHAESNASYRPRVTIIFTTRDSVLIDLFHTEFTSYLPSTHASVTLHLFCTGGVPASGDTKQDIKNVKQVKPTRKKSKSRKLDNSVSISDVTVQTFRPNITSIVKDSMKQHSESPAAFVCGPNTLIDEMKIVCHELCIDIHTEIFEF